MIYYVSKMIYYVSTINALDHFKFTKRGVGKYSPVSHDQSDGSIHRHVGKPAWIEARAHPDADA